MPELLLPLNDQPVSIAAFVQAETGAPAQRKTSLILSATRERLRLRYFCQDPDPWSTFTQWDEPLWKEEVVEVFICPAGEGDGSPTDYAEIEVSPHGVGFDAWIHNPTGQRADMVADLAWAACGMDVSATLRPEMGGWTAEIVLPWSALVPDLRAELPRAWRANFFRVDRLRTPVPGQVTDEYTAWVPTGQSPANFHVPSCFGWLRLTDA